LKWFIRIAVTVLGLLAASLTYVATLDVNQYKSYLIEFVEASTGRSFAIDGRIGLKLSLVPTIAVADLRFGDAPWTGNADMVTVARGEARLALMPLLHGEFALKKIVIEGARVVLQTDGEGRANWILDIETTDVAAPSEFKFDVDELTIRNSVLDYRTQEAAEEVAIDSLSLAREGAGQPLGLHATLAIRSVPVTFEGSVTELRKLFANEAYAIDVHGSFAGGTFTLDGGIERPLEGRGIEIAAAVKSPSLRELAAPFALALPGSGPAEATAVLQDGDDGYVLDRLGIHVARSSLESGRVAVDTIGGTLRLRGEAALPRVVLEDFIDETAGAPQSGRLFSDERLPFDGIRGLDAEIDFTIASLEHKQLILTEAAGKLTINHALATLRPFTARIGDGAVSANLAIDASAELPAIDTGLHITGMRLSSLPKFAQGGYVTNGPTNVTLALHGRGSSVAAIMAGASGKLSVSTGPAVFNNSAVDMVGTDLAATLFSHLNPMSSVDPTTHLECAALNFPISNGIAHNDKGIGVRTDKLTVLGGGTINLRTEAIDIGAKPKPREGIGISLSSLADFIRLGGTLKSPRVTTDAAGAATAGVKVGAAVATAGLSVLVEGLYNRATADADVCAIALGTAAPAARAQDTTDTKEEKSLLESTTTKTKDVISGAGKKVQGVFKSLFGN